MKKIILFAFLITSSIVINAQEINWVTLEEAVELQKTNPRKIMMDMYTVWCGPCKALDRNTFQNKSVAEYINKNYYAVKFNAEGNDEVSYKDKTYTNPSYDPAKAKRRNSGHQLSTYFGVRAYPTIVFLDETAEFIAPIPGYKSPRQLELYLKLFIDDTYKEIKTKDGFTDFQKNLKYEFIE